MKKWIFKENELDKLSRGIMNEIYPIKTLNKYFKLGYAQALSQVTDVANEYINKEFPDKMDAHDLKRVLFEIVHQDDQLKDYYFKLRKDGIKTDIDSLKEV